MLDPTKLSISALIVALLIVLPMVINSSFALSVMNQIGIAIIFDLAFNMMLGQGGMLSFGHADYFGLAGFVTAHVINGMHADAFPYIPVTLIPLVGGIAALFFGIVIGFVLSLIHI